MVEINERLGDFRRSGNFRYGVIHGSTVAFSNPQIGSRYMPIGLVGIKPHDEGADRLLEGMNTLQPWFYALPGIDKVVPDLRSADQAKNLKASRHLGEEFSRKFRGINFFMVYFVGEKGKDHVYSIPASVVLASGYNPDFFTHDAFLYHSGDPSVAASKTARTELVEITDPNDLGRLNQLLAGRYKRPLEGIKIEITGFESGLVIPVNGIKPVGKKRLEQIANQSVVPIS